MDMYSHLTEEQGANFCTYETFRKALREANVSFTRLGSEECDMCKAYSLHIKECHVDAECQVCSDHGTHLKNAEESRRAYQKDRDRVAGEDETLVSVDMMRVTVLPILPHKDLALKTVTVKFLEKGHTSMSADAVHQVVNKFLSKKNEVADFQDFVEACAHASDVVEMAATDFRDISSGISASRLKKLAGEDLRPTLRKMRAIQARRGEHRLFMKESHEQPTWKAYEITKVTFDEMEQPPRRKVERGVNRDKLDKIKSRLAPLMKPHKRAFWLGLEGKNVRDLNG
ncbi:hypothetical protein FJT64_026333 [Amphibalanus amphitrite]|nr:hypothetical protein FJT64_026333 [Amphibalanus amphitrite]